MDIKYFLIIILSGLLGTISMTCFMYMYNYVTHQFTKVIHILGNMLIGENRYENPSKNALIVGTVAHFSVGILFSFSYFLLWTWEIFQINFGNSVLIGIVSGVVAIFVWSIYLRVHSDPPKNSHFHYFVALFLAHIVFAIATVSVFQLIIDNPKF